MAAMSTAERGYNRAVRRARRLLADLGAEFRQARMMAGANQASVGRAARMSASKVSRAEDAKLGSLSLIDAVVLGDAVGLDVSVRAYPGRRPTRDAAHGRRLGRFLAHVRPPLRFGTEVQLPPREGVPEQRAWDALIYAPDGETGVELELRLYDVQAQLRRVLLKWRDGRVEGLLLIVADTASNRRVLREFGHYFTALPRLRRAMVLGLLEAGRRPPTGHLLL